MPDQHEVEIKHQRVYNEWLPICSCGWVGSYWYNKTRAEQEVADHKEKPA